MQPQALAPRMPMPEPHCASEQNRELPKLSIFHSGPEKNKKDQFASLRCHSFVLPGIKRTGKPELRFGPSEVTQGQFSWEDTIVVCGCKPQGHLPKGFYFLRPLWKPGSRNLLLSHIWKKIQKSKTDVTVALKINTPGSQQKKAGKTSMNI